MDEDIMTINISIGELIKLYQERGTTLLDNLDINTFSKLATIPRTYNPSVNMRMRDEERFKPYTEWLQDFGQYGSGKHGKKRSSKRSRGKRTKKKRNYRFY